MAALPSCEASLHTALDPPSEEGRMWTLPLRTHVRKTTEKSFQKLPLHTGSLLKDSSLVVKIAQGCGGAGEGAG